MQVFFCFYHVGGYLCGDGVLYGAWLLYLCVNNCVLSKQGELEKLNQSTDDINRCETELEVAILLLYIPTKSLSQPFQFTWQSHANITYKLLKPIYLWEQN